MRFLSLILALATLVRADIPDIDAGTRSRLGIITQDLAAFELPQSFPAFATVIDPAPLVSLLRQAQVASETVKFSQLTLVRAEKLFSEGNLVPQKSVETARAQLLTDKAAHQTILDTILGAYGTSSNSIQDPEDLLLSKKLLVSISPQSTPPAEPTEAIILTNPPLAAKNLTRAPTADPIFRNIAYLAVTDRAALVPGMILPASLTLPGPPESGHLLPTSAVVWHLGIAWVFHESEPGKFERIQAPESHPTDGGYFIPENTLPTTSIVTTGAQLLLSSEISQPEE